jgi:hypothetical protein
MMMTNEEERREQALKLVLGTTTDDALSCGECYDIAHDEMDERETCDLHTDQVESDGK